MTEPVSVPLTAAEIALIMKLIGRARRGDTLNTREQRVAWSLLEKLDHAG